MLIFIIIEAVIILFLAITYRKIVIRILIEPSHILLCHEKPKFSHPFMCTGSVKGENEQKKITTPNTTYNE